MDYVIVCGSLNMDLVCTTPRIPLPGETIIGHGFVTKEGGKGANQAVSMARLGMPVKMIGCVGQDAFGDALIHSLESSGVDTGLIVRVDGPTGTAHITVEDSGENNIVVIPSANHKVSVQQVNVCEPLIRGAFAALTQFEIPTAAAAAFLRLAKKHGVMTVLNPAPIPAGGFADDIFALVDLITPNETEMEIMTGIAVTDAYSFARAAEQLHGKGVRQVICTLGAKGAFYSGNSLLLHQKAYPVIPADTTCAGDSFTGALVVKLYEGAAIEEALDFAARAAALTVTRLGAQESLPYLCELDAV